MTMATLPRLPSNSIHTSHKHTNNKQSITKSSYCCPYVQGRVAKHLRVATPSAKNDSPSPSSSTAKSPSARGGAGRTLSPCWDCVWLGLAQVPTAAVSSRVPSACHVPKTASQRALPHPAAPPFFPLALLWRSQPRWQGSYGCSI